MENPQLDMQLIHMLLIRLERISADSYWAHRASGIRGALLRMLDDNEKGNPFDKAAFKHLVSAGFTILSQAAKDMTL